MNINDVYHQRCMFMRAGLPCGRSVILVLYDKENCMLNKCPECRGEGFDKRWAFGIGLKEGTPLSTEEAKRRCPCANCQREEFKAVYITALSIMYSQGFNDWLRP